MQLGGYSQVSAFRICFKEYICLYPIRFLYTKIRFQTREGSNFKRKRIIKSMFRARLPIAREKGSEERQKRSKLSFVVSSGGDLHLINFFNTKFSLPHRPGTTVRNWTFYSLSMQLNNFGFCAVVRLFVDNRKGVHFQFFYRLGTFYARDYVMLTLEEYLLKLQQPSFQH